jgi:hypothetical protein
VEGETKGYGIGVWKLGRGVGRQRKLRIKNFLEGGSKSKAKSDAKSSEQAAENNNGKK